MWERGSGRNLCLRPFRGTRTSFSWALSLFAHRDSNPLGWGRLVTDVPARCGRLTVVFWFFCRSVPRRAPSRHVRGAHRLRGLLPGKPRQNPGRELLWIQRERCKESASGADIWSNTRRSVNYSLVFCYCCCLEANGSSTVWHRTTRRAVAAVSTQTRPHRVVEWEGKGVCVQTGERKVTVVLTHGRKAARTALRFACRGWSPLASSSLFSPSPNGSALFSPPCSITTRWRRTPSLSVLLPATCGIQGRLLRPSVWVLLCFKLPVVVLTRRYATKMLRFLHLKLMQKEINIKSNIYLSFIWCQVCSVRKGWGHQESQPS